MLRVTTELDGKTAGAHDSKGYMMTVLSGQALVVCFAVQVTSGGKPHLASYIRTVLKYLEEGRWR